MPDLRDVVQNLMSFMGMGRFGPRPAKPPVSFGVGNIVTLAKVFAVGFWQVTSPIIKPVFNQLIKGIGGLGTAGRAIGSASAGALGGILGGIRAALSGVGSALSSAVSGFNQALFAVRDFIVDTVSTIAGALVPAISGLIGALGGLRSSLSGAFTAVGTVLSAAVGGFVSALNNVKSSIGGLFSSVSNTLTGTIGPLLRNFFANITSNASSLFSNLGNTLSGLAANLGRTITNTATSVFSNLGNTLSSMATSLFINLGTNLRGMFQGLPQSVRSLYQQAAGQPQAQATLAQALQHLYKTKAGATMAPVHAQRAQQRVHTAWQNVAQAMYTGQGIPQALAQYQQAQAANVAAQQAAQTAGQNVAAAQKAVNQAVANQKSTQGFQGAARATFATVGGAASAVGSLGNAALNQSNLQFAATLSGLLGDISAGIPVVGIFTQAVGKSGQGVLNATDALLRWSENLRLTHFQLAEFSGAMARVQAEFEIRSNILDMLKGNAIAPFTDVTSKQEMDFKEKTAKYEVFGSMVKETGKFIFFKFLNKGIDYFEVGTKVLGGGKPLVPNLPTQNLDDFAGANQWILDELAKWDGNYGKPKRFPSNNP